MNNLATDYYRMGFDKSKEPPIIIGREYKIIVKIEPNNHREVIKMKAKKKYSHVILFEDSLGIHYCFTPFELAQNIIW